VMRWVGLFVTALSFPLVLGGCHWGLMGVLLLGATSPGPYRSETLAKELGPQSVRTIGCLDVGLVVFDRAIADSVLMEEMLDFHVGNRCGYPEAIDLRKLVIRGQVTLPSHWANDPASKTDVALWDPRHEIRELNVGGAERGSERIRLDGAHFVERLCFDFDRIAPDVPEARPAEMCFVRHGHQWDPV
jgi:hypothetical protein